MKKKDLELYKRKIKNMTKDELLKELERIRNQRDIYIYCLGILYGIDISLLVSLTFHETAEVKNKILAIVIGSLGLSLSGFFVI